MERVVRQWNQLGNGDWLSLAGGLPSGSWTTPAQGFGHLGLQGHLLFYDSKLVRDLTTSPLVWLNSLWASVFACVCWLSLMSSSVESKNLTASSVERKWSLELCVAQGLVPLEKLPCLLGESRGIAL